MSEEGVTDIGTSGTLSDEWLERSSGRFNERMKRMQIEEDEGDEVNITVHSVIEGGNSEAEYNMRHCASVVLTTTDESDGNVYIAMAQNGARS